MLRSAHSSMTGNTTPFAFGSFPSRGSLHSQYMPAVTTVSTPVVTMAATPVTTISAPPITTMVSRPTSPVRQNFISPTSTRFAAGRVSGGIRDLISMGTVVQENYLSRDDLIRNGHLVPDLEREMLLQRQHEMRPGALVGPHATQQTEAFMTRPSVGSRSIGNLSSQTIFDSKTAHSSNFAHQTGVALYPLKSDTLSGGQTITLAHEQAGRVYQKGETLEVSILHARNLQHMNMTGDSWRVVCEAKRYHGHIDPADARTTKCTSNDVQKTADPVWNELHHMENWSHGADLEFTVFDKSFYSLKPHGKCTLSHSQFYPSGWEGEIPLDCDYGAMLGLRVVPLSNAQ
eukprot:TRINITY_DN8102_c1_g1_i1.p1 TRINITY_DN8102_c1_g1~~TRINITY_DN8102_c1_g1_i1.p1  ORF type:complete len:345 (-),score=37.68 TRINITY_DN8102_c1_g1_i1:216-1250(-)